MSGPTLVAVFANLAVRGTPDTVVLGTVSGEVPDELRSSGRREVPRRVGASFRETRVRREQQRRAFSEGTGNRGGAGAGGGLRDPPPAHRPAQSDEDEEAGFDVAFEDSDLDSLDSPLSASSPTTRARRRRLLLAVALARPVVGVVEALALEVDGRRAEDALDGLAGLGVLGERLVAELLHDLEGRAVLAPVLVDGHRGTAVYDQPSHEHRHRDDGQDRGALQAPRLHLPQLRDLRRPRLDVRLRPLRRAAEDERQERVVARDAPGARRHRRARLGDPPAPARVGGQRPRRRLHRPDGRLQDVRPALPRRPPRPAPVPAEAVEAPGRGRAVRADRGARVQPHVRDERRPGEGHRRRSPTCAPRRPRASSSTSRTSCSSAARSRRSASRRSASRSATRSRPATSSSARASSSRWRWSSSSRPPRGPSGTSTGRPSGAAGTRTSGIRPDHLILREHEHRRAEPLLERHGRRRVPLPDRVERARGHRQPHRLRPQGPRRAQRREARVLRPGDGRALRPARHRARRRRRPRDARLPRRRLRRGGGRGRAAHRAQAPPAPRAGQGRGPAARAQGRPARARARGRTTRCGAACRPSTTRAARSASATAARTRSARRTA